MLEAVRIIPANLIFRGPFMASPALAVGTSLLPIFLTRLNLLQAIVSGLNDMPDGSRAELESLLKHAEELVQESMAPVRRSEAKSGHGA
jgi:hypothetical protein